MYPMLVQVGVQPDLCSGSCQQRKIQTLMAGMAEKGRVEKTHVILTYGIDGLTADQNARLRAYYQDRNPGICVQADLGRSILLRYGVDVPAGGTVDVPYLPDLVSDIFGKK